ncbi:hypothetical protein ACWDRB_31480 [Nonomuraea sp. NPDC003707]
MPRIVAARPYTDLTSLRYGFESPCMGGGGAIGYAARFPGRFTAAASSFSGALDNDQPVWTATQATKDTPAWAAWLPGDLPMASHPVIGRLEDGRPVAFAVDAGGEPWVLPQTAASGPYTSWISLGVAGLGSATPTVTTVSGGIRVFVRGTGGTVLTNRQDNAWEQAPGFTVAGRPPQPDDRQDRDLHPPGTDGAVYSTGETTQGSGTWRGWERKTFDPGMCATDPTAFAFPSVNGPDWAFPFRNADNRTRIYVVPTSPAAAAQYGEAGQDAGRSPPALAAVAACACP